MARLSMSRKSSRIDNDEMASINSAVYILDAHKHYGPKSGPARREVFTGLNMNVRRGTIYGLLGPSGCGKTTLLNCIVGRKVLNSGDIWVLGGTPGSEGSGVPGPRIGYMPQDLAVVSEFTVREMVTFYASLFSMEPSRAAERFRELSLVLELPPPDQRVGQCSGGQMRRVSCAAAIVHDPELLILDEPTVGLDPMLRERIWQYLLDITEKKGVTIIITTHYIEECRNAHRIGLMRAGKIIAEENPKELMRIYGTNNLEDVFFQLSKLQTSTTIYLPQVPEEASQLQLVSTSSLDVAGKPAKNGSRDLLTEPLKKKERSLSRIFSADPKRVKALFFKNWLQFFRNYGGIAFMLLFPITQLVLFFISVGHDPTDVPVAFVNKESNCLDYASGKIDRISNDTDCYFTSLSCRFLEEVKGPMIRQVFFDDFVEARKALEHGKVSGVVQIGANFTLAIRDRTLDPRYVDKDVVEQSEINVVLDMSSRQIGTLVRRRLLENFLSFQETVLRDCGASPSLGGLPVRVETPVYGRLDDEFTMFVMPGFLVTSAYFTATIMTSTVLIADRLEGLWDRNLVAGVTAAELMCAHVLAQLALTAVQVTEQLVLMFWVFGVPLEGSALDVAALLFAQSLAGMFYGFLVSVLSTSHIMANFLTTGSFYPMFFISGVVWPVESMPNFLQLIANVLPFGYPVKALRYIIIKGWGIQDAQILESYAVSLSWTILYAILTLVLLRKKT